MTTATAKKPLKIDVSKYLGADLFKEIGLDKTGVQERVEFLAAFGNVIQTRITRRLMEELSSAELDRLEEAMERHGQDGTAILEFIKSNVPGFENMVLEEVAGYKKELIDRYKA